ncbi:hypothetical protein U1763_02550 [Sphingomonas sp. LB2R24]|uniref:hypothetical protein n=1 Tax=Sphingomonas sorbitolis TaxID=3096165 RepID=UPI002FC910B4
MYMETTRIDRANARPIGPSTWFYEDPTDPDAPEDDVITTTRRGLCRLATVAAEVGGRFQREGTSLDPMGWMLAPRDLFHGGAAIQACLRRDDFMRATLLHGLALGLDADPEEIDHLLDDQGDAGEGTGSGETPSRLPEPFAGLAAGPHLFTAVIVHFDEDVSLHAFHAFVASNAEDVVELLVERHGALIAGKALISSGVDMTDPNVSDLVSPSMIRLLRHIECDPEAPFADGLAINIEQRFDA